MAQKIEPGNKISTFLNPESGAEIARQMSQEPLLTYVMGGLFAEKADLSGVRSILDIYCGPGSWALEMAFHYPEIDIIAIDSNRHMIEYAQAQARVQGLDNIHFLVMNPVQKLSFLDNTFDIVNSRFISTFLRTHNWPRLIHECARVSKAGGMIRLTEADEHFISNSAACERLKQLYHQAITYNGQSFHPFHGIPNTCITPHLSQFLRQSGCKNIQERPHIIDYAHDLPHAHLKYDNLKVLYKLGQPFLSAMGVATQVELDALYEQMLIDMLGCDFHALSYFLTCWGEVHKP